MDRSVIVLVLAGALLVTCGGNTTAPGDLGAFGLGETVTFQLDDTVHVCNEELPYSIVQVTEGEPHSLSGRSGSPSGVFSSLTKLDYLVPHLSWNSRPWFLTSPLEFLSFRFRPRPPSAF